VKHNQTTGIILNRTNFGEADRILTILTPDHGKLRLMARGVRKIKSKLAGGIELFSTSNITFIEGRGGLGTLVSTRLIKHYGRIVNDLDRVQLGYDLIKLLDRATEDHPEAEYYELLQEAFEALDDSQITTDLIRAWFQAQLLRYSGHTPNLRSDTEGHKLDADTVYDLNSEDMAFMPRERGKYTASHIKALRLLFSSHPPSDISKVQGLDTLVAELAPLVRLMLASHSHVQL